MSVIQQPTEQQNRESVRSVLRDLIEQYGSPSAADVEWAERALPSRRYLLDHPNLIGNNRFCDSARLPTSREFNHHPIKADECASNGISARLGSID